MAAKIGKTVGESQPYWPAAPKRPERRAQYPGRAVRRCRLLRFRLLRLADHDADHRRHRPARPALHRLPYDLDVLDHARRAADRPQPSFGRRRLPRQLRFGLSRLSRQDRQGGRHAGRDAAAARLSQLHAGQVARHAAHRIGRDRAVRRLAARPRLRPLLRLPRCRDRPVRARAGARQHAGRSAGHLRDRLSPDRRPRRPGDPLSRRPCRRRCRDPVADLGGARRLPCAAPGAVRPDRASTTRCSPTAGTTSATSASRARRRPASCRRTRACRRATTWCGRGRSCPTASGGSIRACRRPMPRCSSMPTSIWRGWWRSSSRRASSTTR